MKNCIYKKCIRNTNSFCVQSCHFDLGGGVGRKSERSSRSRARSQKFKEDFIVYQPLDFELLRHVLLKGETELMDAQENQLGGKVIPQKPFGYHEYSHQA